MNIHKEGSKKTIESISKPDCKSIEPRITKQKENEILNNEFFKLDLPDSNLLKSIKPTGIFVSSMTWAFGQSE